MTDQDNIREGFLCPMCMQDLGSVHKLQNHFEIAHTAEDKAVLDQVKGLFSKAKGKILGRNDEQQFSDNSHFLPGVPEPDAIIWEPQELGIVKSNFDTFKKFRDARIDRFVIESNKVLIRLDKLIYLDDFDTTKRKEFEQTLVPWVRDGDVPFCPTCGNRFNVARRRHHCRLCGSIMCKKCSLYVQYDLADQLVRTLHESAPVGRQRSQSMQLLPQSSSNSEKEAVRCCHDCFRILQKRKDKLEQRFHQPLLVALYEKLKVARGSADKMAPVYREMAESLNSGEDRFELGKANDMRLKLMKMYETVDVLSKKIAALNTQDEDNPPSQMALSLQSTVRQASHVYLQDNMLTLQSLPSLPKLEILQKERRKQQERRVRRQREEAERERAEAKRLQELEKIRQERDLAEKSRVETKIQKISPNKSSYSSLNGLVLSDGWTPKNTPEVELFHDRDKRNNDPILEQVEQVQKMLHQAATSGRTEEVKSLTINLEELQSEYKKQQSVKAFGFQSGNRTHKRAPSGQAIVVNENPFLTKARQPERRKTVIVSNNNNPFIDNEDDLNPFLTSANDESNSNPFLEQNGSTNPFLDDDGYSPVSEKDGTVDPIFHQICYISKCLDTAVKAGKNDEAAILRQNLKELQSMYNSNSSS